MSMRVLFLIIAAMAPPLQVVRAQQGGPLGSYQPPLTAELKARLTQADVAAGARFSA